jgi:hypothetical protein
MAPVETGMFRPPKAILSFWLKPRTFVGVLRDRHLVFLFRVANRRIGQGARRQLMRQKSAPQD